MAANTEFSFEELQLLYDGVLLDLMGTDGFLHNPHYPKQPRDVAKAKSRKIQLLKLKEKLKSKINAIFKMV